MDRGKRTNLSTDGQGTFSRRNRLSLIAGIQLAGKGPKKSTRPNGELFRRHLSTSQQEALAPPELSSLKRSK